jgi:hypothetical protein
MTAVAERVPGLDAWSELNKRTKAFIAGAAVVGLYALLYVLPGTGDLLQEKAPYGVLFIGTVQGTTTALLAMGLILIYRTNRFVNF